MCSIGGMYAPLGIGEKERQAADRLSASLTHRGPDSRGSADFEQCALRHNRLSVMDPENGAQPMSVYHGGNRYTIVYNGELYNTAELKAELLQNGIKPRSRCDTEVLLYAYALWGEACLSHLNGIFAFAVYDQKKARLFCARDRLGVKPFFYTEKNGHFWFASECKALLAASCAEARLSQKGIWQLLFLSPVTLPGGSVFADIFELLPGECCTVDQNGMVKHLYWQIKAYECKESREEAVVHTNMLMTDAIRRQLEADVPLCTFLSGGLDSSVVSAVAAQSYREKGSRLSTYSFAYEGNTNYAPTLFQPNPDDRYALLAADFIGSEHTVLTVPTKELAETLSEAVYARDFPGQADIDSSLLWFCRRVKKRHTVVLSGECADEIFGGYPWFYRPEMLYRDFFPWIHHPTARASLFEESFARVKEGYAFLSSVYRDTVSSCPCLESDSEEMKTARVATLLSMRYFMASLLERKDRMSMASAVEVRVPFADHRIAEYIYNVPWEMKFAGQVEKALLRDAMASYLPPEILHRKKSPYPKTHNEIYEKTIFLLLSERLKKSGSRLAPLLKKNALQNLQSGEDSVWFGQLMARAQLYAWLYQLDFWLEKYNIVFSL